MNRFWLKIVGFAVFALVVVVAGYIFRPAETSPIKEPKDTEQIQKEVKDSLKTQTKLREPRAKRPAASLQAAKKNQG